MGYDEGIKVKVRTMRRGNTSVKLKAFILLLVIAIILATIISAFSLSSVDVGEAAVIIDPLQQRIVDVKFGPQIFIKLPWQYTIRVYVAVTAIHMRRELPHDYPAVSALTKDGAAVDVDISIRYRVIATPEAVKLLVRNYPLLNYKEVTIVPLIREVVRDVISNFTLTDIIEKRSHISALIVQYATKRLKEDPTIKNCIEIIDVAVRNIVPPTEIIEAINKKLAAQQEALAAEYNRTKLLILANASAAQRIIAAEAEAQATLIRAKAEADAIMIKANATAQSLRMIANVMGLNNTQALVSYLYFETLKTLAEKGGAQIILIGGTGTAQTPIVYPLPMTPSTKPSATTTTKKG